MYFCHDFADMVYRYAKVNVIINISALRMKYYVMGSIRGLLQRQMNVSFI